MDRQKEINKLRLRLLELGQPIIIPAREQKQPENAGDNPCKDITIVPYGMPPIKEKDDR